ncbi:quinone-dependent dihydroorotate dehydrogenase [Oricola cellulosilytica]|uniref:Dihydroorotate dehydrogenase (quinone) n=1 Tax=Oricola cellulosilytica TaxID=1429082 RepID=A0A4R0PFX4_9HYPH|nr:quinone-dependent dihydroorotate dehydrogenase [Oricola cellulosilytica]TCD16551.1 quinone-dependent dihydroorotate dehydrogenase [Oricola cellulosilytica]
MLSHLAETAGRWLAFRFEPETAHRLAIRTLKSGAPVVRSVHRDPRLSVSVNGLTVPNPLGVAAGFDKNAEVPDALLAAGFGFAEIGTVTPLPQSGNPKPRVFRLPEDRAVINRLGFNNEGHAAALARLQARNGRPGLVGVNIGANKDSGDRAGDYVSGLERFYGLASYFTVNISSPNTPGLRDLQGRAQLAELLSRIAEKRAELSETQSRIVPVLLKVAPDITEEGLDDIVAEVLAHGLDGMIVSNTTLARPGLRSDPGEAGGLSGRPLFERSTIVLAKTRERIGGEALLIGAGGVDTAQSALAKIEAGADLVQLYTGMIYRGPGIANAINQELSEVLDKTGAPSINDLIGTKTEDWAAKPIPA